MISKHPPGPTQRAAIELEQTITVAFHRALDLN